MCIKALPADGSVDDTNDQSRMIRSSLQDAQSCIDLTCFDQQTICAALSPNIIYVGVAQSSFMSIHSWDAVF